MPASLGVFFSIESMSHITFDKAIDSLFHCISISCLILKVVRLYIGYGMLSDSRLYTVFI